MLDVTEAAKRAAREYKREWNRKNRDKVRAAQERYWERRAAAAMEATDEEEESCYIEDMTKSEEK